MVYGGVSVLFYFPNIFLMDTYSNVFFSNLLIPGSIREVAKQFLRCVLIKLAPNGIFSELFRSSLKGKKSTLHRSYWCLISTDGAFMPISSHNWSFTV